VGDGGDVRRIVIEPKTMVVITIQLSIVDLADRYLSGERRFREPQNDDDSAADGTCLTAPQDSQADATQQETLERMRLETGGPQLEIPWWESGVFWRGRRSMLYRQGLRTKSVSVAKAFGF
jgi:hypothetical protein